jgi:hypothetical protein
VHKKKKEIDSESRSILEYLAFKCEYQNILKGKHVGKTQRKMLS